MPESAAASGAAVPWYRTITREQWLVLAAAKCGWMLDAMDFMLYAMAVGRLRCCRVGRTGLWRLRRLLV